MAQPQNEERQSVHVVFFDHSVEDRAASIREGRPIFKDVEYAHIRWLGSRERELKVPAHSKPRRDRATGRGVSYAQLYPREYQAFKDNKADVISGTPLKEATFLTEAKRSELRAINIHTIEALADLADSQRSVLGMNGFELIKMARAYVEKSKGIAVESKLAAENAALQARMDAMQKQMEEIMSAAGAKPRADDTAPVDPNSPFAEMDEATLKVWIKDATGSAPRGQPSRETLIRMADEIMEAEKKKQQEAA